jgi:mono/diheme cytochrome c family protein
MLAQNWRASLIGLPILLATAAAQAQQALPPQTPAGSTKGASSLFTSAQAARGETSYNTSCGTCHGSHLDDGGRGGGPPLRGPMFQSQWGSSDVAGLFTFTRNSMPPDNPGGLNDSTYADILAYILQSNGYKAGESELPTDPAAQAELKLGSTGD